MDQIQALLIKQEIHERLLAYWRDVDENGGRNAGGFWTEDAVWDAPARTFNGRQEIQGFFDWRLTRGDRLALHTVANFTARVESDEVATATWYLLLYAADGTPVQPSEPAQQVAAIEDRYVRAAGGPWLCAHRKFRVLFTGGGALGGPPATENKK
jgi:SnoaL-like domain